MGTKYIIDNVNGAIPQQVIYGALSATTFYGDGSNLSGITITPAYKSFTAYYNVEEDILQVYENTIGPINVSYNSLDNDVIITSSNLFGLLSSGTPEKTAIFLTVTNGIGSTNNGLEGIVSSSSEIKVSDGYGIPGAMVSYSLKFFIEIRVYN